MVLGRQDYMSKQTETLLAILFLERSSLFIKILPLNLLPKRHVLLALRCLAEQHEFRCRQWAERERMSCGFSLSSHNGKLAFWCDGHMISMLSVLLPEAVWDSGLGVCIHAFPFSQSHGAFNLTKN